MGQGQGSQGGSSTVGLAATGKGDKWMPHGHNMTQDEYKDQYASNDFAGQWSPEHKNMTKDEYQKQYSNNWKSNYAGEWKPTHSNMSKDEYMNKYAGEYRAKYASKDGHYAESEKKIADEYPDAPKSSKDCNSLEELKQWRGAQEARINALVPESYRSNAVKSAEKEFDARKADLEESPMVSLRGQVQQLAADASTDDQTSSVVCAVAGFALGGVAIFTVYRRRDSGDYDRYLLG